MLLVLAASSSILDAAATNKCDRIWTSVASVWAVVLFRHVALMSVRHLALLMVVVDSVVVLVVVVLLIQLYVELVEGVGYGRWVGSHLVVAWQAVGSRGRGQHELLLLGRGREFGRVLLLVLVLLLLVSLLLVLLLLRVERRPKDIIDAEWIVF